MENEAVKNTTGQHPQYDPQLQPYVDALQALGYSPESGLADAATRLARTPELLADIRAYLKSGKPAVDEQTKTPAELFRPLPGNYNVAGLIRDFQLEPTGAFLMASDLMADTERAIKRLDQIIEEGFWKMLPDGSYAKVVLPVSERYPACPNCGLHWAKNYPACPRCGYGPREAQIDQDLQIVELLQEGEENPSPGEVFVLPDIGDDMILQADSDSYTSCPRCGAPLKPTSKFCGSCGKLVAAGGAGTDAALASPPHVAKMPPSSPPAGVICEHCGAAVKTGKKFCWNCGKPAAPKPHQQG
jgi:predicted amidophosphoribosyltransferase